MRYTIEDYGRGLILREKGMPVVPVFAPPERREEVRDYLNRAVRHLVRRDELKKRQKEATSEVEKARLTRQWIKRQELAHECVALAQGRTTKRRSA